MSWVKNPAAHDEEFPSGGAPPQTAALQNVPRESQCSPMALSRANNLLDSITRATRKNDCSGRFRV
jgi:hypothetical protein